MNPDDQENKDNQGVAGDVSAPVLTDDTVANGDDSQIEESASVGEAVEVGTENMNQVEQQPDVSVGVSGEGDVSSVIPPVVELPVAEAPVTESPVVEIPEVPSQSSEPEAASETVGASVLDYGLQAEPVEATIEDHEEIAGQDVQSSVLGGEMSGESQTETGIGGGIPGSEAVATGDTIMTGESSADLKDSKSQVFTKSGGGAKKSKVLLIVIILVILAAGAAAYFFLFANGSNGKKDPDPTPTPPPAPVVRDDVDNIKSRYPGVDARVIGKTIEDEDLGFSVIVKDVLFGIPVMSGAVVGGSTYDASETSDYVGVAVRAEITNTGQYQEIFGIDGLVMVADGIVSTNADSAYSGFVADNNLIVLSDVGVGAPKTGWMFFVIKKGAENISFRYSRVAAEVTVEDEDGSSSVVVVPAKNFDVVIEGESEYDISVGGTGGNGEDN